MYSVLVLFMSFFCDKFNYLLLNLMSLTPEFVFQVLEARLDSPDRQVQQDELASMAHRVELVPLAGQDLQVGPCFNLFSHISCTAQSSEKIIIPIVFFCIYFCVGGHVTNA